MHACSRAKKTNVLVKRGYLAGDTFVVLLQEVLALLERVDVISESLDLSGEKHLGLVHPQYPRAARRSSTARAMPREDE